jgi:hypothetical protein
VFGDPGDRVDEPAVVVVDCQCGNRRGVWCKHLQGMGVAVSVAADHGVHYFGKHRHSARISLCRRTVLSTTWMEVTEAAYL